MFQSLWLCLAATIVAIPNVASAAQDFSWARHSGGDSPGLYDDGTTANFEWEWSPGGETIGGTAIVSRTGAGVFFAGGETHRESIEASGFVAPEYNNSQLAVDAGGVENIYHFLSDGELGRGVNDVATGSTSTTNFSFLFSTGKSAPADTLITLFDPGATEGGVFGPFTYDFDAYLNGNPVDTSRWTLMIEDPYTPVGNASTEFSWDDANGILRLDEFAQGQLSGINFPDTLVFLDTNDATFDELQMTVFGLAIDTMAVGFGANTAALPVPEPETLFLMLTSLAGVAVRRRLVHRR